MHHHVCSIFGDSFRRILVTVVVRTLPIYLPSRLQSIINAAAWLIAGLRRSDHIPGSRPVFTGYVHLSKSS